MMILSRALVAFTLVSSPASAIVIGEEDRRTIWQYAKEQDIPFSDLPKLFGAVLRIKCPWGQGAGVLVSDNGVVLTAEHIVFKEGTKNGLFRCTAESLFQFGEPMRFDWKVSYRGSELRPRGSRFARDFAVLKLRNVTIDAEPFEFGWTVTEGSAIALLATSQADWPGHDNGEASIGQCHVLRVNDGVFHSDCDSSKGSSGGSTFLTGERRALIGLAAGVVNRPGTHCDGEPWCSTIHFTITPDIRAIVERLAGD